MLKPLIHALLIITVLASCSTLKPTNTGKNQVIATGNTSVSKTGGGNIKFLDDISVTARSAAEKKDPIEIKKDVPVLRKEPVIEKNTAVTTNSNTGFKHASSVEKASALQLKYSVLLNTEVELLQNKMLLEHIDEWYGTRYRMGGTSKSGIDCSAFVQVIYLSAFAVPLPRTARDQYKTSRIISATELKEGDLVFFNTRGGISHVGIYLQNNKFVHASSSNGVMISDLFDPYYLKRYMGAGRIEKMGANIKL